MKLTKRQRCVCERCGQIIDPESPFNCPKCGELPFSMKVTYKKDDNIPTMGERYDKGIKAPF